MIPQLNLQRTAEGTPYRLLLRCDYSSRLIATALGFGTARWRKKDSVWVYPVDPVILREVLTRLPQTQVSLDVWREMDALHLHQEEVQRAVHTEAPLYPNDALWPFQRASVRFLHTARRALLNHDMGCGKTVIACRAIDILSARRVLIVAPDSAKWSWVQHLYRWTTASTIATVIELKKSGSTAQATEIITGSAAKRTVQLGSLTHRPAVYLCVNYDQMRIHATQLASVTWDVIIYDEAHRLKDRKALRTQAAFHVAQRAPYVWLLTGSPIRSKYEDMWSLLHLCDPDRFSSYWNFIKIHLTSVPGIFGGLEVLGIRNQDLWNRMMSVYSFGKTKKEVLPYLPESIYRDDSIVMLPQQEEVYEEMLQEFRATIEKQLAASPDPNDPYTIQSVLKAPNVISQITRLRQICLDPRLIGSKYAGAKLSAVIELVEDLIAQEQRFILFTCFKQWLDLIDQALREKQIVLGRIHGGVSAQERMRLQEQLSAHEIPGILGTIQSMGEGMNLQAATVAIFTDQDWTPSVNRQAEDRIRRPGIKTSPLIVSMVHPKTIEAHIRQVCAGKKQIESTAIGQVEVLRRMLFDVKEVGETP